jgi:hypothetical protein
LFEQPNPSPIGKALLEKKLKGFHRHRNILNWRLGTINDWQVPSGSQWKEQLSSIALSFSPLNVNTSFLFQIILSSQNIQNKRTTVRKNWVFN